MNKMVIIITSIQFSFTALVGLDADAAPSHLGDCILLEPLGDVPSIIYEVSDVAPAEDIEPFARSNSVWASAGWPGQGVR